jgi:hypothetical protein
MRGLSLGRHLAKNIFLAAFGLNAFAHSPYTVSVGNPISSQFLIKSAAFFISLRVKISVFIYIQFSC